LLLNAESNIQEVFFFASMIHLVLIQIHPWNDGNSSSKRLLE
jgi:prophage maintenance system killer protein